MGESLDFFSATLPLCKFLLFGKICPSARMFTLGNFFVCFLCVESLIEPEFRRWVSRATQGHAVSELLSRASSSWGLVGLGSNEMGRTVKWARHTGKLNDRDKVRPQLLDKSN